MYNEILHHHRRLSSSTGENGTLMAVQSNPRVASSLKSFSRAASATVVVIGCLVLTGWLLDIALFKSVLPGLASMKANTALAFCLAGASVWLWGAPSAQTHRTLRNIAQVCAFLVLLIGLLTLGEYLFGMDLGLDQLLFRGTATPLTSWPGRMAPATAFNFCSPARLCCF